MIGTSAMEETEMIGKSHHMDAPRFCPLSSCKPERRGYTGGGRRGGLDFPLPIPPPKRGEVSLTLAATLTLAETLARK